MVSLGDYSRSNNTLKIILDYMARPRNTFYVVKIFEKKKYLHIHVA